MESNSRLDPFKILLHDISKKLTDSDFESLKFFAGKLPCYVKERIEGNRGFSLLVKLEETGTISKDNLCWLNVVFKAMRLLPVLELLHEYEIRQSGVSPFKLMLHQVAREIDKRQLHELVLLCSPSIDKSTLDEIQTPLQLMIEMERRGKVAKGDVDFLKKLLYQIENKKLAGIVEEYCKQQTALEENAECQRQSSFQNAMVQKPKLKNTDISRGPQLNTSEVEEKIEQEKSTEVKVPDFQLLEIDESMKKSVTDSTAVGGTEDNLEQKEKLHQQVRSDELSDGKSKTNEPKWSCGIGDLHRYGNVQFEQHRDETDIPGKKMMAHIKPLKQSSDKSLTVENPADLINCGETIPKRYLTGESESCTDRGLNLTLEDSSQTTDCMQPKQRNISAHASEDSTKVKQPITDEVCHDQPVPTDQGQKTHEDGDGMQAEVTNETMEQQLELVRRKKAEEFRQHSNNSVTSARLRVDDVGQHGVASRMSGVRSTDTEQYLERLHIDGADYSLGPESFVTDQDAERRHTEKDEQQQQQQQQQQQSLAENDVMSVKSHQPAELYNYQKELAEPALNGVNCIMCAPTGSGKTRTAAYICYELRRRAYDEGRSFKALFIVCIRNLIEQQKEELAKVFDQEENNSMIVAGINETTKLSDMLEHFDIVVLTAQILVNCLKNKEVYLDMFDLLILDECHHTNLGHPYNVIMHEYHKMKREECKVPQIVGLTASLGVGDKDDPIDHYVVMCANLDCTCLTHVRNENNLAELLKYNPRPQKDQIISVEPRDPNDMFILTVAGLMYDIECLMTHKTGEKGKRGSQKYENWIVEMCKAAECKGQEDDIYICETLRMLNSALMYYEELPATEVMPLVESYFSKERRAEKPTPIKQKIYELYDVNLEDLNDAASIEELKDNEKLNRLCNLLADLYLTNDKSKGLLLTRTRFCVEGLVSFIRKQDSLKDKVKCGKLIGQGRGDGTMTDKEQQTTLENFKKGSFDKYSINLLVATDVAQEGLDMPLCNFVIRYNFVSNEIGSVQSRGRARAKNSECYLIVNKGSINEIREYQNLEKEHAMLEALNEIDRMDEEHLQQRIKAEKEKMWKKKEATEQRKSLLQNSFPIENITIHCRGCKQQLCRGTDLRKRGCNFIVYCAEFEERIYTKDKTKPLTFRYDSQIAYTYCKTPSCNRQIGPKIKYQQGKPYGYALSRDAVMWKMPEWTEYRHIRQWSKVPFMIPEEDP